MRSLLCFASCMVLVQFSKAQCKTDSTTAFEEFKGHFRPPIKKGSLLGPSHYGQLRPECTFIGDQADTVFAVFGGYITSTIQSGSNYAIAIQYGSYSIRYSGLGMLFIKKGDIIKSRQALGILGKDVDDLYSLQVQLTKDSVEVQAIEWFNL